MTVRLMAGKKHREMINNRRGGLKVIVENGNMRSEVTTKEYWDQFWGEGDIKHPVYNIDRGLFYSYKQLFTRCFEDARARLGVHRLNVIDCGCGEGLFLRFIAEQFENIDLTGIEYSDAIEKSRKLGEDLDLEFNLIHGDIFDEWDAQYLEKFDVVMSVGLIEHFREPSEILVQMNKLLKPGGVMVTIIPSFAGIFNFLWRVYDSKNYSYHVPISHGRLSELHHDLGLNDVQFFRLGTPTLPGVHDVNTAGARLTQKIVRLLNDYIIKRIYPVRQESLEKQYPMVSTVAAVGVK